MQAIEAALGESGIELQYKQPDGCIAYGPGKRGAFHKTEVTCSDLLRRVVFGKGNSALSYRNDGIAIPMAADKEGFRHPGSRKTGVPNC
jgi:hypothetical protein